MVESIIKNTDILHQLNKHTPMKKNDKLTLLLIVIVFALPPLAAYFMYFTGMMPETRSNKGILIKPQEFPSMNFSTMDNKTFSVDSHAGKWTLFMLADEQCNELCKRNIYLMRQVKRAIGKDSHQVSRMVFLADESAFSSEEQYFDDYPQMTVLKAEQQDVKKFSHYLKTITKMDNVFNKVFIIDPYGRTMMHYNQHFKPRDLLSDLKRLIMVNSNDSVATM